MENVFHNHQNFDGDIYVADYTEFAKEHCEKNGIGVVISDKEPEEIASLTFRNPNKVPVLAVNFEKNEVVFRLVGKEKVSNCECMLVSRQGSKNRWVALAELKYCKGEDTNIIRNFETALIQLRETFLYLRDKKHIFDSQTYRFFWIISMPEHNERIPFGAFFFSQDERTKYKNTYGVNIIDDNVVNIWTGTVLK